MPVAAVSPGGSPRVSAGSSITIPAIMVGCSRIFLVSLAWSTITAARPTSEPVPAVVGMATIGGTPAASARRQAGPPSA